MTQRELRCRAPSLAPPEGTRRETRPWNCRATRRSISFQNPSANRVADRSLDSLWRPRRLHGERGPAPLTKRRRPRAELCSFHAARIASCAAPSSGYTFADGACRPRRRVRPSGPVRFEKKRDFAEGTGLTRNRQQTNNNQNQPRRSLEQHKRSLVSPRESAGSAKSCSIKVVQARAPDRTSAEPRTPPRHEEETRSSADSAAACGCVNAVTAAASRPQTNTPDHVAALPK